MPGKVAKFYVSLLLSVHCTKPCLKLEHINFLRSSIGHDSKGMNKLKSTERSLIVM
jgi:hypothetical protein